MSLEFHRFTSTFDANGALMMAPLGRTANATTHSLRCERVYSPFACAWPQTAYAFCVASLVIR